MTHPTSPSGIHAIGDLLNDFLNPASRSDKNAQEIQAILQAMTRLLLGVPLQSDGKLTIKTLSQEAGLQRNKLTHKHTGLKDLFNALVKAQNCQPTIAADLHSENEKLRATLAELRQANQELSETTKQFARIVHVLEVENQQLRNQLTQPSDGHNVRFLHRPDRSSN